MRFLMMLTTALLLLTGCIKDEKACSNIKPASEQDQIVAYAAANGITATRHSSGLYYEVLTPGTGAAPTINSRVSVTYTGKFLNGALFDQSVTPVSFNLNQVIEGWTVGIPLISAGGKIKLIVPSSLAYGCNGARTIPANSILFFEVDLLTIQ